MRSEIQDTELYKKFKIALNIQDMRADDNPYIVKCCEIAEEYAKLNLSTNVNNTAIPEWLTDDIRILAKNTWNSHEDVNDHKRIKSINIIRKKASDAGYTITIKKASELLQEYCL